MTLHPFDALNQRIVSCESCPRLRAWCQEVARIKRAAFQDQEYWGLPVPNLGDPNATGLIVGLAPAAHGANRTGQMFTGDRSGDWLFRALYKQGLANLPKADSVADGLQLSKVIITAVNHCAPPANKPTPEEMDHCSVHLRDTLSLQEFRSYLCLGQIAWAGLHRMLAIRPAEKFRHGARSEYLGRPIFASFHPSQQNTFTGKLTEDMLDKVMDDFASHL